MAKPTSGQMMEFWTLVSSGHINSQNFQAFLRNPNQRDSGIIELELTYSPNIVDQLGVEGEYRNDFHGNGITDDNYPTVGEGGAVRYHLISGKELKRELKCTDNMLYRSDVEAYFRDRGMRFPNPAEALLLPAKDKQLGRGDHRLVAFIDGSHALFSVNEVNPARRSLDHRIGLDRWHPYCEFVAVCE